MQHSILLACYLLILCRSFLPSATAISSTKSISSSTSSSHRHHRLFGTRNTIQSVSTATTATLISSTSTSTSTSTIDKDDSDILNDNAEETPRTTTKQRQHQQEQDISMEKWYETYGVICPSIELRTTPTSVGGRGLFWKDPTRDAVQGDIVAFIPQELVFEVSNLRASMKNVDDLISSPSAVKECGSGTDINDPLSWQTILTTYAYKLFNVDDCNEIESVFNDDDDDDNGLHRHGSKIVPWREWIQFWDGGGPPFPRPSESYTDEEIQALVDMMDGYGGDINNSALPSKVKAMSEVIDKRFRTFKKDLDSVKSLISIQNEDSFASLYSIVLSRTASLGPQWKNSRGILPLHDMINHPPNDGRKHQNIELFCVGDLRDMVDHETFVRLLSSLPTSTVLLERNGKEHESSNRKGSIIEHYSDKDVILVARKNIRLGDELLLSYRRAADAGEKVEGKMWLLLQYGFPFW